MGTVEKNRFSELLEELLNTAEIKNANLAKSLQYDVSYISKWISGRMLPAEKTKRKVLQGISHEIVKQGSKEGCEILSSNYQVVSEEELEAVIYDNLEAEYDYVQELQRTYGMSIEPKTHFFASLSPAQYIAKMHHPVLRRVQMLNIMAEMDLLALVHEYRLQIVQGDMRKEAYRYYPDVHFSLLIDLAPEKIDYTYDPIFLLNMIADMSRVDFNFYKGSQAAGRMIFAVKDDFLISGMLMKDDRCMGVTISTDAENCNPIYYSIADVCTREILLCRKTTMNEMIESNDYVHSLLAMNKKCLIGHMTEHFLPDDLFEELLEIVKTKSDVNFDEASLRYLHVLTKKALEETVLEIMIDSDAFFNLAVENELDFFDYKIRLSLVQRTKYISYLQQLCNQRDNLKIKLIYGQIVSDFQYNLTQCIFLSDTISYLRLDTKSSENDLIVLNHPDMQVIFTQFFDTVWNGECGEVLSSKEEIDSFIEQILHRISILESVE